MRQERALLYEKTSRAIIIKQLCSCTFKVIPHYNPTKIFLVVVFETEMLTLTYASAKELGSLFLHHGHGHVLNDVLFFDLGSLRTSGKGTMVKTLQIRPAAWRKYFNSMSNGHCTERDQLALDV